VLPKEEILERGGAQCVEPGIDASRVGVEDVVIRRVQ
jgi:hypothetical protein